MVQNIDTMYLIKDFKNQESLWNKSQHISNKIIIILNSCAASSLE